MLLGVILPGLNARFTRFSRSLATFHGIRALMHETFDQDEFSPVPQARDTELTLGPLMLLGLLLGLALVCGLFFGLGYVVGHRGAAATQAATSQAATVVLNPSPSHKPSASTESAPAQPQPGVNSSSTAQPAAGTNPETSEQSSVTVSTRGSSAGQQALPAPQTPQTGPAPQTVRPALPLQTAPQPAGVVQTQPALAGALMVQIAAVSHSEDAEVLVAALRRRGYAVSMSRDAAGLIHVRIGPFSDRNAANSMRDKLLNDGYNAIVQP